MKLFLAFLLAAPSTLLAPVPPTIATLDGENFVVTFGGGADQACTIFEQQNPHPDFPEGYKPKICWYLDSGSTSYENDWYVIKRADSEWIVYAAIGYPRPNEYLIVETNRLIIHR
jgi:hypothetical protein